MQTAKVLRFLNRTYLPLLGLYVLYGAVFTLYAGQGGGALSLMDTYYQLFPLVPAICLYIFGSGVGGYQLDLAVSLSCPRRVFFWGNLLYLLVSTAVLTALTALFFYLPGLLGWPEATFMPAALLPVLFPLNAAVGCLAQTATLIRREYRRLGTALHLLGILLMIALFALFGIGVFFSLPPAVPLAAMGVLAAVFFLCAALSARFTLRAVVR